jgi:hypothetical protein
MSAKRPLVLGLCGNCNSSIRAFVGIRGANTGCTCNNAEVIPKIRYFPSSECWSDSFFTKLTQIVFFFRGHLDRSLVLVISKSKGYYFTTKQPVSTMDSIA